MKNYLLLSPDSLMSMNFYIFIDWLSACVCLPYSYLFKACGNHFFVFRFVLCKNIFLCVKIFLFINFHFQVHLQNAFLKEKQATHSYTRMCIEFKLSLYKYEAGEMPKYLKVFLKIFLRTLYTAANVDIIEENLEKIFEDHCVYILWLLNNEIIF